MTPPNHERMSSVDTAWLRMDSPGNAMMIVSVTATQTPLRLAEFRRMVETRFLCFPRFRLRPAQDPLGASWIEDDAFELDNHLLRVKLPAPAGKPELQALAAELAGRRADLEAQFGVLRAQIALGLNGSAREEILALIADELATDAAKTLIRR